MPDESRVPEILNLLDGEHHPAHAGEFLDKYDPHTGELQSRVARSRAVDVERAVQVADRAWRRWAALPPVQRANVLYEVAYGLKAQRERVARIVARETGKSYRAALGETDGAVALGLFMASEGQRLYGKTTTSGNPNRMVMTVREPIGVAGLIIAANTPIANVAWKVFPALICGNGAILKAAEDTPQTAQVFGEIATRCGLPAGVLNIIHGHGAECGAPLVAHPKVAVISFTGSTAVGREIGVVAGKRLARVSLELGGKNPFIVCDDADLDLAADWAAQSAFSNAGQRCAAGSRIIVFDDVYDDFKQRFVRKAESLRVGPGDEDDFGPVINSRQLNNMLGALQRAVERGARVLTGGRRLTDEAHAGGYYLAPTIVEGTTPEDEISRTELFGPITNLYRANGAEDAIRIANDSSYGLTAAVHTTSIHRAMEFVRRLECGAVMVNLGTFGSEPHMPFGGVKDSGNGTREPGTEALNVYSNLKNVYLGFNPDRV